jgi:hypothetical protein
VFFLLATDDFTRADENPLATGWTDGGQSNVLKLVSNHVEPVNLAQDGMAFYSSIAWPLAQASEAKVTVTGTAGGGAGIGPAVRCSAGNTCYRLVLDHAASNNCAIQRFVAAVFTSLVTFTQAFTDGDAWTLAMVDATLYVYYKGLLVKTFLDTTPINTGSAGLSYSSTETAAQLDDWRGYRVDFRTDNYTVMPKFLKRPDPARAEN